jgi:dTDP-glucose 4,6-dehydratase
MNARDLRMKIVVTGGAGFIGSALVRHLIGHTDHEVLVIDKLTYAGNLASLASVQGHSRYRFSQTDICDRPVIADIFSGFDPDAVGRFHQYQCRGHLHFARHRAGALAQA